MNVDYGTIKEVGTYDLPVSGQTRAKRVCTLCNIDIDARACVCVCMYVCMYMCVCRDCVSVFN